LFNKNILKVHSGCPLKFHEFTKFLWYNRKSRTHETWEGILKTIASSHQIFQKIYNSNTKWKKFWHI
jgi:hypothetical protein